MNQKNKIIAPSKNTFQNMGGFHNCSLKKDISVHECILKLLPQKIHFRTWVGFKIAPSKNTFQNMDDFLKLLPENVFFKTLMLKNMHKE